MNSYLVMTHQIPRRTFEIIQAATIAEAAEHGTVMLLVRTSAAEDGD